MRDYDRVNIVCCVISVFLCLSLVFLCFTGYISLIVMLAIEITNNGFSKAASYLMGGLILSSIPVVIFIIMIIKACFNAARPAQVVPVNTDQLSTFATAPIDNSGCVFDPENKSNNENTPNVNHMMESVDVGVITEIEDKSNEFNMDVDNLRVESIRDEDVNN